MSAPIHFRAPQDQNCIPETRPTIFVVDDDASVRRGLQRLLKSAGFTVATFASAQEFLDHSDFENHDLLILDVRMPGISGLDLQKKLAAAGAQIPIIFISAYEDDRARRSAMEAGAIAFLQKPFDYQVLLQAIKAALKQGGRE